LFLKLVTEAKVCANVSVMAPDPDQTSMRSGYVSGS
jgi:hypothetical protein